MVYPIYKHTRVDANEVIQFETCLPGTWFDFEVSPTAGCQVGAGNLWVFSSFFFMINEFPWIFIPNVC